LYNGPSAQADSFSNILRYDLSDPNLSSLDEPGASLVMTGCGSRSNFTNRPFAPQDIVILTDGFCGSTCALFVEMMTVQAGVKVIVLGGCPQNGP
jgi:hypothetical protein